MTNLTDRLNDLFDSAIEARDQAFSDKHDPDDAEQELDSLREELVSNVVRDFNMDLERITR